MLTSKLTTATPELVQSKFPLLAQSLHKSYVVLFESESKGMVVQTDGVYYDIGYCSSDWIRPDQESTWKILPKGSEIILKVE